MFFPLMIAASHGLILETAGTIGDGLYNAILMSNYIVTERYLTLRLSLFYLYLFPSVLHVV